MQSTTCTVLALLAMSATAAHGSVDATTSFSVDAGVLTLPPAKRPFSYESSGDIGFTVQVEGNKLTYSAHIPAAIAREVDVRRGDPTRGTSALRVYLRAAFDLGDNVNGIPIVIEGRYGTTQLYSFKRTKDIKNADGSLTRNWNVQFARSRNVFRLFPGGIPDIESFALSAKPSVTIVSRPSPRSRAPTTSSIVAQATLVAESQ